VGRHIGADGVAELALVAEVDHLLKDLLGQALQGLGLAQDVGAGGGGVGRVGERGVVAVGVDGDRLLGGLDGRAGVSTAIDTLGASIGGLVSRASTALKRAGKEGQRFQQSRQPLQISKTRFSSATRASRLQ